MDMSNKPNHIFMDERIHYSKKKILNRNILMIIKKKPNNITNSDKEILTDKPNNDFEYKNLENKNQELEDKIKLLELELDKKNNLINTLNLKISKLQSNLSEVASVNYLADKLLNIEKSLKQKDVMIEEITSKLDFFEKVSTTNQQNISKIEIILKNLVEEKNQKLTLDELKKKLVTKII
jgi:hypothetical protein